MYAMQASCPVVLSKVALSSRRSSMRQMRAAAPARRAASFVVRAEDESTPTPPSRKQRTGFIAEDNSGKSNIFAIEPETVYLSSPGRDAAAKEGLGGALGGIGLVAAVLGVGAALFIVANGQFEFTIAADSWDSEDLLPLSYYLKSL
mmetsp:Transcript_5550/g.11318  ORF Transcript_5550/g.11318 Transcript_5550/m.11318 type:complete len:147 (-) Transcript_5550:389-829(-)|eukprot:CAMPEP_0118933892 /NCGR_PEP_ID=MMETSP1169-20130426/12877_1 /TAXON_ID=36882 /ORGANISM="Pyramimonas obovata, Strain CCMP722" /LENGTH=146 /DNA_ID=CAMNT_0006876721 /DNA_START=72 /DNA_END=512 /DNA_ORIENTATION=+